MGGWESDANNFNNFNNFNKVIKGKQKNVSKQVLLKQKLATFGLKNEFKTNLCSILEEEEEILIPDFSSPQQIISANVVLAETTETKNNFDHNNLKTFLTKTNNSIFTILDSGANEFMIRENNLSTYLNPQEINIQTASKEGQKEPGFFGGMEEVFFNDQKTPITFGKKNQAVFAKGLTENLSSVGRICETGLTVIFNKKECLIFKNENLILEGICVHKEDRNINTGLYSLTMFQKDLDKNSSNIFEEKECNLDQVRIFFTSIQNWALDACLRDRNTAFKKNLIFKENILTERKKKQLLSNNNFDNIFGFLSRFYKKEGMSEYQKWHEKLGHVSPKILRKCQIKNLIIPKQPQKCEACIAGKMHRLGHANKTSGKEIVYKPGEHIITDLQGPYTKTLKGHRYSQIFLDISSKKIWTVRLHNKTESDGAIASVLEDSCTRTGKRVKFLKTDGDGILNQKHF